MSLPDAALEAFKRAESLTPPPGRPNEPRFWEAEAFFRLKRFTDARAAYDAVFRADAAGPLLVDVILTLPGLLIATRMV